jgi:hypothetical protein
MASPRLPLLLRLIPLVLLCLSPACAAGRVPVSVYYETLCPFCSAFVVNDLSRIFHDGVSSIADLRLVPFGNGRVSADGSISCQVSVCHRSILSVEFDMFLKKFNRNFGRIEVHLVLLILVCTLQLATRIQFGGHCFVFSVLV